MSIVSIAVQEKEYIVSCIVHCSFDELFHGQQAHLGFVNCHCDLTPSR